MSKYFKTLFLLIAIPTAFLVPTVFAEESLNTDSSPTVSVSVSPALGRAKDASLRERIQMAKDKNQEIRNNIKERASASAEKRQERLSELRLKLCEARQKNISNRIKFMQERAENIHKAHERIYKLVDKFYTEKLVPNGYTLSNYADLKADVEANKANVLTLLDSAKTSGSGFSCTSDDPKGQADAFREDMKALIDANQAYRVSIKNFTQAVRDLAKTAKLDKVSGIPTPSVTEGAQ